MGYSVTIHNPADHTTCSAKKASGRGEVHISIFSLVGVLYPGYHGSPITAKNLDTVDSHQRQTVGELGIPY
jgi:hypothetical protein